MAKSKDDGTEYFLDLHRQVIGFDGGYWATFRVTKVPVDAERPHGFQYSLTFHEESGDRVFGFDNSHHVDRATGPARKSKRSLAADHIDRRGQRSVPYEFTTPHALLEAFFDEVERYLSRVRDQK